MPQRCTKGGARAPRRAADACWRSAECPPPSALSSSLCPTASSLTRSFRLRFLSFFLLSGSSSRCDSNGTCYKLARGPDNRLSRSEGREEGGRVPAQARQARAHQARNFRARRASDPRFRRSRSSPRGPRGDGRRGRARRRALLLLAVGNSELEISVSSEPTHLVLFADDAHT